MMSFYAANLANTSQRLSSRLCLLEYDQTPDAPEAAPFLATLQQQQKNFLKPGIIALTYQKIATNCVISRKMQIIAFSVVKPNKRMRANVARIVIDAILLSLLKIFAI